MLQTALKIVLCLIFSSPLFYDKIIDYYPKLKAKYKEVNEKLERISRFRYIFLLAGYILSFLLYYFFIIANINFVYLIYYAFFITIFYFLISLVSSAMSKDQMNKFSLFKFICSYFIICFAYTILFTFIYYTTFTLGKGQIYLGDKYYNLDIGNSFYLSIVTFLSNYLGFNPEGIYMKVVMIIQVLTSQIILLGFLFSLFGEIINKKVLNKSG